MSHLPLPAIRRAVEAPFLQFLGENGHPLMASQFPTSHLLSAIDTPSDIG